jgi:hypothetical protein
LEGSVCRLMACRQRSTAVGAPGSGLRRKRTWTARQRRTRPTLLTQSGPMNVLRFRG